MSFPLGVSSPEVAGGGGVPSALLSKALPTRERTRKGSDTVSLT